MALLIACASGLAAGAGTAPTVQDADEWSSFYRNWTYYSDWAIPPSCLDPDTCKGKTGKGLFSDIAQVWRVPGSATWSMSYTFFDGVGYQTAIATSKDLLKWDQSPGTVFSPRADRKPLDFNATPGDFDYGGAAFVGQLVTDYNITAPRELLKVDGSYWTTYFAQPTRYGCEPPPGATGLARSSDGMHWERGTEVAMMDTYPARGAKLWEQNQIYAPYLLAHDGVVYDFYNANSGTTEQTGVATLPLDEFPGIEETRSPVSKWRRYGGNPIVANGPTCVHQAADPKVYYDSRLDNGAGAWAMFYFGTDPKINRGHAGINVAFSKDLFGWTKATHPLYEAGGHPKGLDKSECHKVWLTGDGVDDTIYMFYTGDSGDAGRGILLLTSKPVE